MYITRKSEINYVKRSTSAKRDRARKLEKKKSTSLIENSKPRMFSVLGRCARGGLATGKDIRLKKLVEERELFLEQIKRLKAQIEGKPKNTRTESPDCNEEVLENGTDVHVLDSQRDANRQISDLKFKLAKSEQEITALEQNVMRLEAQVTRYRSAAENAEKVEDELKAEKRKLQRELRTYLDKIEELEVSNSHLSKRLEKMKANRSALLSQQ